MSTTVVAVGGFASNVGKTTLVCEMLRRLPGWEAIKLTRGHYRSCGKNPHTCCVSHLLSDQPLIQSGHEKTYTAGKDTARFWDAGATNVHWVIATDAQVREGILEALSRVRSAGVIIEGTSPIFLLPIDYAVMVARSDGERMKPSARKALDRVNAFFTSDGILPNLGNLARNGIIYTSESIDALVADVKAHSSLMVTRI
jgi:molybdopterin-guanine dinucleotide biosynthesis protein